jgi:GT2 family glycosyltransferase
VSRVSESDPGAAAPRVSVVFLLYNAASEVPALVEALRSQSHPGHASQAGWLEAIFMDDASRDSTAAVVERALVSAGSPAHWRLVRNPRNLGLAATLNEAFARARAPFVLTCHLDCRFGSERYVASMLEFIASRPRAAAITGKPVVAEDSPLPFAEKLNVVANLMDVLPDDGNEDLVPVGFAEGRCDVFRVEALRSVGFYDTHLRVSGEDQLLAAKLRRAGWEILQAPRLRYLLSVSGEQDSVSKLVRHQNLFGRTDPYILLRAKGTHSGITGARAGANRRRRALLRAAQVLGAGTLLAVAASLLAGVPAWPWALAGGALLALRACLYRRHGRAVKLSPVEWARVLLLQPVLDLAFTAGLVEGFFYLARGVRSGPIR